MEHIDVSQAAALLAAADDVLIITHVRPDGDAAGSGCSLCRGLRALGRRAYLAANPPSMARYEKYMLPYFTPGPAQFPAGWEHLATRTDLAVDHHGTNSGYAKYTFLESDSAAAGELVYLLLRGMGAPLDADTAEALYVALSTDTNCFRTPGTTGRTLTIAGALREAGFDAASLTRRLFETKSPARLRLESALFGSMELHDGICAMVLPLGTVTACGATEDDMDKLSLLTMLPEGTWAGLLIRELPGGTWKVSLRTDGSVHAGSILHALSPTGGGHADAAGAVMVGPPEDIRAAVLTALVCVKNAG